MNDWMALQNCERELKRLQQKSSYWAELVVSSQKLSSEEISHLMQVEPDDTLEQGTVFIEDYEMAVDETIWTLSSEKKLPQQSTIESHITWILSQLEGNSPNLRLLLSKGASLRVVLHLETAPKNSFIDINSSQLGLFARFGIDISLHYSHLGSTARF